MRCLLANPFDARWRDLKGICMVARSRTLTGLPAAGVQRLYTAHVQYGDCSALRAAFVTGARHAELAGATLDSLNSKGLRGVREDTSSSKFEGSSRTVHSVPMPERRRYLLRGPRPFNVEAQHAVTGLHGHRARHHNLGDRLLLAELRASGLAVRAQLFGSSCRPMASEHPLVTQ